MIDNFLQPDDQIIDEFSEIQSGRKDNRVELWKCINLVKKTKSKLLIPRLDRFSRKVSFISGILDTGVDLVVSDNPNVSKFHLHLLSCFAEEERRLISERTRLSLQESKKRGTILGKNGSVLGRINHKSKLEFIETIKPQFELIRDSCSTLLEMSKQLNEQEIPTMKGGKWYPQTVKNYLSVCD